MPALFIETIPIKRGEYQFMQSLYIGYDARGDWIHTYLIDERLEAAIINLGMACRYLHTNYQYWKKGNMVILITDTDGKDIKYNGEHNALHGLIYPHNSFEAKKFESLYGEYNKYLLKIRELMREANILIKLGKGEINEIF